MPPAGSLDQRERAPQNPWSVRGLLPHACPSPCVFPRAGLCGSLSPTSGARRRMSCPQPPGRRRPPRTSRCSRPPPPPPVSSAAGRPPHAHTAVPPLCVPTGPPSTHALQGLGRRHPPLPTRPAHAWLTGLVVSPRAARVPGVPGVPAEGPAACSCPHSGPGSWGLAEALPCSKERVCPSSYCDPLRTDHYLWRLDL